jgi:hypothetical protein
MPFPAHHAKTCPAIQQKACSSGSLHDSLPLVYFSPRSTPALLFSILSLAIAAEGAPLSVSTDFPGGSAEVLALDSETGTIHIRPPLQEGRGWPCWWYFRVDGASAGQPLTLKLSGNPGVFRPGGAALAANWAQPVRAAISSDDRAWSQTGDAVIDGSTKTAVYRFEAPGARFWMAWGPPFLPSHATALLEQTAAAHPDAEPFTLATTKGGRPVKGIRLGKPDAPAAVWVQARQHAWEAGSSWVGQGFLNWVTSEDPLARTLRETTEIYFVPIMDVDNVATGAGGKDAVPRDHNRDWADQPLYPEVAAAQRRLAELDQSGRLRLFLDLHNPGPGDKQSFFFGPFDYETMPGPIRAKYSRWLSLATAEITGPLPIQPQYRFATYVRTEEERGRMSSGWVRNHTGPERVASITLETSWNTPESTQSGYLEIGGQLGRTVARFLKTESP